MRYYFVDILRFFAIALMVFYHFSFDLNFFEIIKIPIMTNWFWYYLPRLIVFLFLSCVGFSLRLQHLNKIRWDKFIIWEGKLLFFALIISIVSYYAAPRNWIYFGTLHAIATTGFMALPFMRWPRFFGTIGVIQLILFFFFKINIGWIELSHSSLDYIPALPWIGAVFIGFALHYYKESLIPFNKFKNPFVSWVSHHSLKIYLIHQLILFPIAYLLKQIIN
jgi:uncharacterized membrane protein